MSSNAPFHNQTVCRENQGVHERLLHMQLIGKCRWKIMIKSLYPFPSLHPRLLGVDRVVIYNTSCGPELDRLLQSYSKEGFLEVVPWPIDKHLVPSYGWLHSQSGGDVHYFGQQTTLNECIYRSMERSRYVLLNDIDEIIMPYQHMDLMSLMNTLQPQHPKVGHYRPFFRARR